MGHAHADMRNDPQVQPMPTGPVSTSIKMTNLGVPSSGGWSAVATVFIA